jgi:predicted AAA+ superfamily ATPase
VNDLIERHALASARHCLDVFPIVTLEGARRVGKSVLAGLMVADRSHRVVTLDTSAVRRLALADPEGFATQWPDGTLVIDEIQRVPELILAVKAAVDADPRPGRFVLTGSSDLLRLERTPDSLAGRAATVTLRALSQGEIRASHDDVAELLVRLAAGAVNPWNVVSAVTRAEYAQIVAAGGYPEAFALSDRDRATWVDSYLRRIVQRDVKDISRADSRRLLSVLRVLAANQAGELVRARIASDTGIPVSSVATYVNLAETLFLADELPPWTPNLTDREVGRTKAVITDPALAVRLARIPPASLADPLKGEYLGPLLEGFVATEVAKQRTWSAHQYELFHYRDRVGPEVDLVLEFDDGRVFGIEVKASRTIQEAHFKNLRHLRDKLGERFAGGLVLNTAGQGASAGDRLWSLPVSAVWASPA